MTHEADYWNAYADLMVARRHLRAAQDELHSLRQRPLLRKLPDHRRAYDDAEAKVKWWLDRVWDAQVAAQRPT